MFKGITNLAKYNQRFSKSLSLFSFMLLCIIHIHGNNIYYFELIVNDIYTKSGLRKSRVEEYTITNNSIIYTRKFTKHRITKIQLNPIYNSLENINWQDTIKYNNYLIEIPHKSIILNIKKTNLVSNNFIDFSLSICEIEANEDYNNSLYFFYRSLMTFEIKYKRIKKTNLNYFQVTNS